MGTVDNSAELGVNTELAAAAALEEYKSFRTEIIERVKNEFVLVAVSATLTGAGVALSSHVGSSRTTLLFALPLLSFVIGLLHFSQEVSIAVAAEYLHKSVRPRIAALIGDSPESSQVMDWESFRVIERFRRFY